MSPATEFLEVLEDFLDESYDLDEIKEFYEFRHKQFKFTKIGETDYLVIVPWKKSHTVYIGLKNSMLSVNTHGGKSNELVITAAIYFLYNYLNANATEEDVPSVQVDTLDFFSFQMTVLNDYSLRAHARSVGQGWSQSMVDKVTPVDTAGPNQKFTFKSGRNTYTIQIDYDRANTFSVKCSCGHFHPMCNHIVACFAYIHVHHGQLYYASLRDFTKEKNAHLQRYNLTVDDPEAADFQFEVDYYGQLKLYSSPSHIVPAGLPTFYDDLKRTIVGNNQLVGGERLALPATEVIDFEIGFVFNTTTDRSLGVACELCMIRESGKTKKIKRLALSNLANLPYLQSLDDTTYESLLGFRDTNLMEWLKEDGGGHHSYHGLNWKYLNDPDTIRVRKRFHQLLSKIWPWLMESPHVYLLLTGSFSAKNLQPIRASKEKIGLAFEVFLDERFLTIKSTLLVGNNPLEEGQPFNLFGNIVVEINKVLHLPESVECMQLLTRFQKGFIKFPVSETHEVIKKIVAPLQARYEVDMHRIPNVEVIDVAPTPRVLLAESNNKNIVLRPQFEYGSVIVNYDTATEYVEEHEGSLKVVVRHKQAEQQTYDYLRTLHPFFKTQKNNQNYFLPFDQVMVKNWFLDAIRQMQQRGLAIYGLKELKKFKYNTNKATIDIKASSGNDWFDLKMNIAWGDQHISLKELKKAIVNNQEAVLLDDGTLGLIPEEWLKQYAPLMKMGAEDSGTLRVSKLHYALLDDMDAALDSESVRTEIAEKKKQLLDYDKIKLKKPSKEINAVMRPYQVSGFHWMQSLEKLGWGGCLADDMGLGKTLQTISFLHYLKDLYATSTHLIVCPTSLIFNWEAELQKFGPTLKYHTYYGTQRTFDDDHFEKFHIVLTTYGMVRGDFEHLQSFSWHYIILDESQAIKNPDALVTKALMKLKSKNRLILSGTPIQNNTYDLYGQFTFLNPGFLGNREFFKNEFATPIDKNGDKEKATQLRRMIYPFMLRRTKDQVALDLPDKTETILWCSMESRQRTIYDQYKNHYRELLKKKIKEDGLAKSGIYVLEGLLRLRQICDHPALLKEPAFEKSGSIKIKELMREVHENTGSHKLLIFSQFTEMLAQIRNELTSEKSSFCYLDGSTSVAKRKAEVARFQTDEQVKIFLISLKAGGVGLNLTEADYVYLIDPWWNPAAEQQAIDRTHRIGQTKKVFAYKLICKDSIEEKILLLQSKKKDLATDLISEEAGFVKKLTPDDIDFLFT